MREYVPQLNDDVLLRLVLSPFTEEWAEDLILEAGAADECDRTDEGLVLTRKIGGNCNALANARMWLSEIEDALDEGEIDPMYLTLTAHSFPPAALTTETSPRTSNQDSDPAVQVREQPQEGE